MNGHDGWGWFGGGFMWLFWLIGLLVIIALFKLFKVSDSGSSQVQEGSALEILKKRYARGEIDETEFERRKKELE